jgi:HK97 gp10 family phage protein
MKVREAAQRKIDENAAELVSLQKSLAPEDQGELVASIRYHPYASGLIGGLVLAGGEKTTRPVRNGVSVSFDYALAQEFGTEDLPPSPFFYPPYRINRRKYSSRVTRAISKAIRDSK